MQIEVELVGWFREDDELVLISQTSDAEHVITAPTCAPAFAYDAEDTFAKVEHLRNPVPLPEEVRIGHTCRFDQSLWILVR